MIFLVVLAGEAAAFVTHGKLSLGHSKISACASRKAHEPVLALRMGYLDNIGSGRNMEGKDRDGNQVMPSFEEYLEVDSSVIDSCLIFKLKGFSVLCFDLISNSRIAVLSLS